MARENLQSHEAKITLAFQHPEEITTMDIIVNADALKIIPDYFETISMQLKTDFYNVDADSEVEGDDEDADNVEFFEGNGDIPMTIFISSILMQSGEERSYLMDWVANELKEIRDALTLPTVLTFYFDNATFSM